MPAPGLQPLLTDLARTVIEAALEAELAEHLTSGTPGNSRNGSRPKVVRTVLGPVATLERDPLRELPGVPLVRCSASSASSAASMTVRARSVSRGCSPGAGMGSSFSPAQAQPATTG